MMSMEGSECHAESLRVETIIMHACTVSYL